MWDQVPELILIEIFHNLNREDRVSIESVCHTWRQALASPKLWRSVIIYIDRDHSSTSIELAVGIIIKFLTITF